MLRFLFISLYVLFACTYAYSSERNHPYVWADKQDFARLRLLVKQDTHSMRYGRIINWADAAMGKPVKGYKISSFEGEGIATACAFAYQMTGDRRYAERAKQEIFAMLKEQRWCSAKHASFTKGADLGHGHCSMACATVYDWCYDTFSAAERQTFISNAERLSLDYYKISLEQKDYWVDNLVTNWAGTCHGGAGCLALAMYDDSALARELAPRARQHITTFLKGVHLSDGGGHEGVMYHHYGLSYGHVAAEAMQRFFKDDDGLWTELNKKAVGYWSFYLYAPDGIYANFNDFHEGFLAGMFDQAGAGKANHYFAELFALYESKVPGGDPFLLWAADHAHGQWTYGRTAPWWLLWRRAGVKSSTQRPPLDDCVYFRGAQQAVWKKGPWWVAMNGGWTSNRSHWNKDLGTFILVHGTERIIRDPGYGKQETKDHSCLLINGQGQASNVAGKTIRHGSDQGIYYFATDLSSCYPGAGIKHYTRHFILIEDQHLVLLDHVQTQKPSMFKQQFQMNQAVQLQNQHAAIQLPHGNIFMSSASPQVQDWQHSGGKQGLISQSVNGLSNALICTIFSQGKMPTHTWKQGTLHINKRQLSFKASSSGLLLYSSNDERLHFGNGSERSFSVHRKDERLQTKKPERKQRSKKQERRVSSKKEPPAKDAVDLSTWDRELIHVCKNSAQQSISFFCSLTKADSTLKAASDTHITLATKQMTLPLPWSRLSNKDKAALAQALARSKPSNQMTQALAAVYLKASGELIKSNKHFALAGELQEQIRTTFD